MCFSSIQVVFIQTTESGHHLIRAEEQDLDGSGAIKKRGCLYLCHCEKYEVRNATQTLYGLKGMRLHGRTLV